MNYGYRETISKQKNLVSTGQRLSKKSLVVFFKILLYILLLICITGCALVFGIVRGIIDAAPDIQDVSIVPSSYSTTVYNNKEKEIAKLVKILTPAAPAPSAPAGLLRQSVRT